MLDYAYMCLGIPLKCSVSNFTANFFIKIPFLDNSEAQQ